MKVEIIGTLAVLAVCGRAAPGEVAFSSAPQVTRESQGARVEFVASAAVDCAISILDKAGDVVRHFPGPVLIQQLTMACHPSAPAEPVAPRISLDG